MSHTEHGWLIVKLPKTNTHWKTLKSWWHLTYWLLKPWSVQSKLCNGHPWELKKASVWQRFLIKLRFRLAVDNSNWPLLTGGCCSQVVVNSGLTVYTLESFPLTKLNSHFYNICHLNQSYKKNRILKNDIFYIYNSKTL